MSMLSKHITVRAENIEYGTVVRQVDRPGYVYTESFRNGGSLPIKGILSKTKTVTSTFTWSVTESLKVQIRLKINLSHALFLNEQEYNVQIIPRISGFFWQK